MTILCWIASCSPSSTMFSISPSSTPKIPSLLFPPSSSFACNRAFAIRTHSGSNSIFSTTTRKKIKSPTRCNAQLSELAPTASAAYGALLLGGGLFAYTRSGSKGSLFGGLSGAVLMGAAYFLMQSPETKDAGDALGFGSAFLFSAVFGIRLAATRKLIPSGALMGVSLVALAVFISAYIQDRI